MPAGQVVATQPSRSGVSVVAIVIAAVLILAGLGVILYVLLSSRKSANTAGNQGGQSGHRSSGKGTMRVDVRPPQVQPGPYPGVPPRSQGGPQVPGQPDASDTLKYRRMGHIAHNDTMNVQGSGRQMVREIPIEPQPRPTASISAVSLLTMPDQNGRYGVYTARISGQIVIGTDEGCDIRLTGDPSVSRRHALIIRSGDQLILADLNATNGTWIGGDLLKSGSRAPLYDGAQVTFGQTTLFVRYQ